MDCREDLPYLDDGDPGHRLDIYWPRDAAGPLPTVVHFHGGAFISGTRTATRHYCHLLAQRGFVVFNVDFRHIDGKKVALPDIVRDCAAATRWAEEHAAEYGSDPQQLFLSGTSSGALLATWCALLANGDRLPLALGLEPLPCRVRAIGCHSGLFDLNRNSFRMRIVRSTIMSRKDRQTPEYQALFLESNHDLRALPPVFMDTSDQDFTEKMIYWFDEQLTNNCVPHRLMVFDTEANGKLNHGFAAIKPDLPESTRAISAMGLLFRENLSSSPASSSTKTV